jgi:opacity protein-like surface antigen
MSLNLLRGVVVCSVVALSACSGNPAAPTPPPPVPQITFTGVYSGTYTVASCSENVFCSAAGFVPGARFGFTMSLGQTQNSVSGNVAFGGLSGNFQGTATGNALSGTANFNTIVAAGQSVLPQITTWSSTLAANNMTGSFTLQFAFTNLRPVIIAANFTQLNR